MTNRVYILIDLENVQPTPAEMGLVRGSQYCVRIFHGPHQNKLDVALAKSLQPLGEQVDYIQCGRNGRNALDFHIAFYLGRLMQLGMSNAEAGGDRYVIVSKDGGFDALLDHLRGLGHAAFKAASVTEAVGGAPLSPTPATILETAEPSSRKPEPAIIETKTPAEPKRKTEPDLRKKVIDNLREHPKNRPSSRAALARHITTIVGNKAAPKTIEALITGLERDGVLKTTAKRITYSIPEQAK